MFYKLKWFDILLYKIFIWRWNFILINRPDIREILIAHLKAYDLIDTGTSVKFTVTVTEIPKDIN